MGHAACRHVVAESSLGSADKTAATGPSFTGFSDPGAASASSWRWLLMPAICYRSLRSLRLQPASSHGSTAAVQLPQGCHQLSQVPNYSCNHIKAALGCIEGKADVLVSCCSSNKLGAWSKAACAPSTYVLGFPRGIPLAKRHSRSSAACHRSTSISAFATCIPSYDVQKTACCHSATAVEQLSPSRNHVRT